MLHVLLSGFGGVMGCVMQVALGGVRVVRGAFVIAGFMVLGGLAVMTGGMLVMLGCLMMVLGCFLGHVSLLVPAEVGLEGRRLRPR
jgi:hypothetical protein